MRVHPIKTETKTMWNYIILDRSGSMSEGRPKSKLVVAYEGILAEIDSIKKDDTGVSFMMAVVEFEGNWLSNGSKHKKYVIEPSRDVLSLVYNEPRSGGGTPLYATIGEVLEDIQTIKPKEDPCIVAVFTDGGENTSYESKYTNPDVLKKAIADAESNNISVKFIGTEGDVFTVVNTLGVSRSNTLTHNNTSDGMAETFKMSSKSRANFSKSYASGASTDELMKGDYFVDNNDKNKPV